MPPTLETAKAEMHRLFGHRDFLPGQAAVLRAVFTGQPVLALLPTGGGKSLCFQLPALLDDGLTIVISPLIALMRDQVLALKSYGECVATLNSGNDAPEDAHALAALRAGSLRLLYLSPERFVRPAMLRLLAGARVRRIVVDEAHCVSQWGHDFRPDYFGIRAAAKNFAGAQMLAFTATADAITRGEIEQHVFETKPLMVVAGFDRPNLHIALSPRSRNGDPVSAFVHRHRGVSGIVYTRSRPEAERRAAQLLHEGHHALVYHAGMTGTERAEVQDRFMQSGQHVVVATVAFGLGIDKPDIRFVAHADMPPSIERYYQEIGRAGRDGLPAKAQAFFLPERAREKNLPAEFATPDDATERAKARRLAEVMRLCQSPGCRRRLILRALGEESPPCRNCDRCNASFGRKLLTYARVLR
jgi:ATP-dependent DNA helicase RecQ